MCSISSSKLEVSLISKSFLNMKKKKEYLKKKKADTFSVALLQRMLFLLFLKQ